MTLQEIRELIQVVVDSGVAELEVQRGENRVRIRRSRGASREVVISGESTAEAIPAPASGYHMVQPAAVEASIPADVLCDPALKTINSPIVGTFYEASAPDTPAFVKVGDRIEPGKVVCIIESMKLMNEIEAEFSGTIVSQLIENGRPVEYGEALFAVRPA